MAISTDACKKYAIFFSVSVVLGATVGFIGCLVISRGHDTSFGKASLKYMGQALMPASLPRAPSLSKQIASPSILHPLQRPLHAPRVKSAIDSVPSRTSTPLMMTQRKAAELRETVTAMIRPGLGLLASDESTFTVGGRLELIGLENNEENRRIWHNLLFTTPGIAEYISGAILLEETLYQNDPDGKPFVDVLKANDIIPGIQVDKGLKPLVGGGEGETRCSGLDDLAERAAKYYAQGARFAKWRTALKIDVQQGYPTDLAIDVVAQDLARYARICQENGLVPIVDPEMFVDGTHDITTTCHIQDRVLSTVYQKLHDNGVIMEGLLLKPSMTVPGSHVSDKSNPSEIAKMTVQTLDRCLPPTMPRVNVFSGGISDEDSSIYLNEIGKKRAFTTTFFYSHGLQSSCIKIWGGQKENYKKAQDQLLAHARANSEASLGKYVPIHADEARAAAFWAGSLALFGVVEPAFASDVWWVEPTKLVLTPLFAFGTLAFVIRIVLSWFPRFDLTRFPWAIVFVPTEPFLKVTRTIVPPVGGVDITPVVWAGIVSFLSEILIGDQGLLVMIEQSGGL